MTFRSSDPVRCAEAIIDRAGRDIALALPIGIGKPVLLTNALYRLAEADRSLRLRIFTGLTLVRPPYRTSLERRFVAPLLDRLFATYPDVAYIAALRGDGLPPNIEITEFFLQAGAWTGNARVQQSYASLNYSQVAKHLERVGTNVFGQLVAPHPRGQARISLSSNTDITLDMRPYVAARRSAGQPLALAVELNANLPYMTGEAEFALSEVDVVLEPEPPHYDLFAPPKEPVSLSDYAMALFAAVLIKDGGTLQIGIGSFSDALTHALILRHTKNREFRALLDRLGVSLPADAQLAPFSLGLYGCTEMLVDGFLALMRAGILRRRVIANGREAVLHAGFFVGSQAFYRELREMPRETLDLIGMTGISFTNTLNGEEAAKRAQRRDARFVNTAMVATLLGAVSSDQLEDGRVVSGAGGQHDLVAMAHALDGARSIIGVRSTRRHQRRSVSNIVWRYANATVPRQLRDIVVTEYGIADLRGKSDRDVIVEMLQVADSAFQPVLIEAAQSAGKLERPFQLPPATADNRMERIAAALAPARASELLPAFPLGSEMTEVEQALTGPLTQLKAAGYAEVVRILVAGLGHGPGDAREQAAIERLALGSPASLRERAARALVLGAMRRTGIGK